MSIKPIRVLFLFAGMVVLTAALSALAQDEGKVSEELKKAIYQYRQEGYDESIAALTKIKANEPQNPLVEYYLGLCYKKTENYLEATKHLEASLSMTPKIKGALIELIDTLYRINELEEAKKWIAVAEEEGVRPAQAAFLKGLTLLKNGEYESSIAAFTDAKDLDRELAASADYQIGVAHLKLKRYDDAKRIFADLVTAYPDADISDYAARYVDAIDRKKESEKPFRFTLRSAFEYDSNVLLKPSDTSVVTSISDEKDTREVLDFRGDYTLASPNRFLTCKTGYALRFQNQNYKTSYNNLGNTFSLQPAMNFEKAQVTFPVTYTHYIVNEKNYLSSVTAGNMENFMLPNSNMVQVGAFYKYDEYLRPPFGFDDRSGNEAFATAGWFRFFSENKGFINLKYTFVKDWARGENWQNWGNKFAAGALVPFFSKFKAGLNGEVFLQQFEHDNTVYEKKRSDQVYSASALLSYEFYKDTELQFQYTYVRDRSNLKLYDYSRHVLSGAVQYRF